MQGIYLSDLGLKFVKTCFTHYSGSILFIGIFFAGILLLHILQLYCIMILYR